MTLPDQVEVAHLLTYTFFQLLEKERSTLLPAGSYPEVTPNWERDVLAETEELLASLPEVTASPKEDDMLTAEDKDEQPVSLPDTKEEELFKTPEVAPDNEAVPGTV